MTLREIRWPLVVVLVAVMAGTLAGITSAAPAQDVPQQGGTCTWNRVTTTRTQNFHRASAMDTTENKLYLYGGINQNTQVQNSIEAINLSDPDITKAASANVSPSGPRLEIFGAAGAYRPKGDDSAVFFIGGARDVQGDGENIVQRYTIKSNSWEQMTVPGSFTDRLFHAAAYDPQHDVIVVHGGVRQCDGYSGPMQIDCSNAQGDTMFLTFNAMTGAPSWTGGPSGGPGQIFGHTMVYDSVGKRMIVFGGTTDGAQGRNTTFQLDLSDPDITKAAWKTLSGGSAPPSRAFHGAAYDAANNRMVVASGMGQNFLGGNESSRTDSWALNLGGTSPAWGNLNAASGERIAPNMEYSAMHTRPVLVGGRREYRTGSLTVANDAVAISCQAPPATNTPRPGITPSPGGPTPTAGGPIPTNTPQPTVQPGACAFITNRVPAAVINAALSNPAGVQGYNELQNPGVPESPWNVRRTHLSLRNPAVPWHPLYNGLIYKAGCP